jgi:hypothetical protein
MCFLALISAAFVTAEGVLVFSLADLPVHFVRNVIFDFGLGPILLKDTYILGLRRTIALSPLLYYVVVYVAVVSAGAMVCLLWTWLRQALSRERVATNVSGEFVGMICFLAGLMYVGAITLSGFHDRYLIPMCMLGIIWLASGAPPGTAVLSRPSAAVLGLLILLTMGFFSVTGLRDFMAMKRALKNAQDYVERDLGISPCDFDGGLEFNGYHCYRPDFDPRPDLSWWWVQREKYVVTLGPLPGYEMIRIFPFQRILGGQSAVQVLKPVVRP